ncbi:MAG: ribosome biogenesis GTPase Der [Spirochaetes bacterium RBG_16_49_21]|nr:MAG: ribosome biogenesis GTPase Der [Spirochaetes bacterium RBG_16_49_21]
MVAIVGRRNVGKSTLFNALIRRKRAIVDAMPGLTRDIISYNLEHSSVLFALADSPGLDLPDSTMLSGPILSTARDYLKKASVIILLVENPAPAAFDLDLAEIVRKLSIPVIAAVNKMDGDREMENMSNFYEMGFPDIVPVSAKTHFNLTLLLDKVLTLLPVKKTSRHEADLKITIVGRPNCGKSTLLNSFIGYNRAVVSEIPGTTRDSVDEDFMYHGKRITVIDTAGIRKKSHITENIEYYSLTRTREAIERCDVAIHLIDGFVGLTETDKKISDEIMRVKRPVIIAINKWDMVEKDHTTFDSFTDRLTFQFYKAADFPIISISAKNKLRIHRIIDTALKLKEKSNGTIETSDLNRLIAGAVSHRIPQLRNRIKIYYATQTGSAPPRFKFFVNKPEHFRKDTIRYFEKLLQKELDCKGVPIVIQIEGKKGRN